MESVVRRDQHETVEIQAARDYRGDMAPAVANHHLTRRGILWSLGRGARWVGPAPPAQLFPTEQRTCVALRPEGHGRAMKVKNSLRSLRSRHRDNRVVRRKGRVYIINKTQRRYKARQG